MARIKNSAKQENKRFAGATLIAAAGAFLVALATVLHYVHAGIGQQVAEAAGWVPELAMITVRVAGQALWCSGTMDSLLHWAAISAGCTTIIALLVVFGVNLRRRATL
jgi:hypothetical protein